MNKPEGNHKTFFKPAQLKLFIGTALVAVTFWQCATKLYVPDQNAIAAGSTDTYDELMQGRQLYADNCGKCHRLHKPEQFNASQWQDILGKMQPKAKISDQQRGLIYKYLVNAPKK